ncbi:MAG: hypothetical protein P8Y97_12370, partial [Candidatus Lokiarchaeota archaeon]
NFFLKVPEAFFAFIANPIPSKINTEMRKNATSQNAGKGILNPVSIKSTPGVYGENLKEIYCLNS